MATEFNIRRTDTELQIRVVARYPVILRFLLPAFLAAIAGFSFYKFVDPVVMSVAIIAGVAIGILALRSKPSELLANNFEFVARSRFGRQYITTKVISRVDILGFKYKKSDLTEPIGRPRGLYVVRPYFSTCILAYIDGKQCDEVVEAIYERFPEMKAGAPFKPKKV